jgi:hypothetical protein
VMVESALAGPAAATAAATPTSITARLRLMTNSLRHAGCPSLQGNP